MMIVKVSPVLYWMVLANIMMIDIVPEYTILPVEASLQHLLVANKTGTFWAEGKHLV